MTSLPRYLTEFPSFHSVFPFYISINSLDTGFPAHRHDFFELSLVIEGEGKEMINHTVHDMMPGTFTFVMPYQIHKIETTSDQPLRLINCNFGMNLFTNTNSHFGINHLLFEAEDQLPAFFQFEHEDYERMKGLLKDMIEEYQDSKRWRNELITAKLVEVLVRFDRARYKQYPQQLEHQPRKRSDEVLMWDIIQYIHKNYRKKLSLSIISKRFHISGSVISELFKYQIGQNFVDFLHDIRIRHACSLLVSTDMNISEIAFESGFGSYKTFSRVFRDQKKVSPVQFRKLYGQTSLNSTIYNNF
ncbi:AraC family transcriptional regulator [Aquibacillus albus]|uniref:AraC-like DNA-binding protein n=1 Tax=Aquibacillus albus TaxID=1168171 RepID=A0ABS2MXL3_9BACI|nr:AraC family transcriptional regulator [Aquibacillus albus]MBM7570643.1 AraC-like DNA-binding protein [Aquibacillus albus]